MALFAPIFALLGRFAGRLLTTTLGWASTLLFGRVRQDRQIVLAAMTFGSIVWVALLLGVLIPDVGTILLGFVPVPDWVDPLWVRLAMLAGAVVLPLVVGAAVLAVLDDRPSGAALVRQVLRGYVLTPALAAVLVFLAVYGTIRKVRVLARGWSDVHIPLVVHPGRYDEVVEDLERALDDARLLVERRHAPAALAAPGHLLVAAAGPSVRGLVPERLMELVGEGIEILVHQSDIAISGGSAQAARARAAIATRLTASPAWRTTSPQAQLLEDRMTRLVAADGTARRTGAVAGRERRGVTEELRTIDALLATLEVDADEWEVLYRIRLQIERDLLAGRPVGHGFPGDDDGPPVATGAGTSDAAPRPASIGAAAAVAALLALDIVVSVRERFAARH